MEGGFASVSHRTVAARAGLPLSATTYYFTSLDDLLEGTVQDLAEKWLADARTVVALLPERLDAPGQLADALLRVAALAPAGGTGADTAILLSLYDRYVEAARHPRLRPVIAEYDAKIEALLAEVLHRSSLHSNISPGSAVLDQADTARLVLAVIDGALLRALAEGAEPWSVTGPLRDLLCVMSGPQPS